MRGRGVHLHVTVRSGFAGPRALGLLAEEDHEVTVYNRGLTWGGPSQGVKVALVVPGW